MKQAKQQSQDLNQTDDFLTTIMKPGYLEKEKAKHPPETSSSRQLNGRPKMPRVDSFSRFSEPPAPPPQQPLPEKPDALPRNGVDGIISPLRRSDTEKPKPASANSPVSRESSQILSLIEALSSAKRELDSQGARVKELETLLLQERSARESAEEKARSLERSMNQDQQSEVVAAFEPPSDLDQPIATAERAPDKSVNLDSTSIPPTTTSFTSDAPPVSPDGHTKQLEVRLETMVVEMEEMRKQVAAFKDRAHKAEDESAQTRKSLTEMVETLRRERTENVEVMDSKPTPHAYDPTGTEKPPAFHGGHQDTNDVPIGFPVVSPETKGPEDAATTLAKQKQKQSFVEQSSPYASMLGVVLLGVGLMAYLNGWQKMDR